MATSAKQPRASRKGVGGRPTKYEPRFCDEVVADMAEGFSLTAFAGKIGVNRDTIDEWRKVHPEFSEACTRAKAHRLRFWEQTAINVAAKGTGGPGAATVITFGLKNMGDDEWRDKRELAHSFENLPESDLDAKLAAYGVDPARLTAMSDPSEGDDEP